jgi:hypothetical protein
MLGLPLLLLFGLSTNTWAQGRLAEWRHKTQQFSNCDRMKIIKKLLVESQPVQINIIAAEIQAGEG